MQHPTVETPIDSPPQSLSARATAVLRSPWPAPVFVDAKERARVVLGAAVGIVLTALLSHRLRGGDSAMPWLVAPLGARAVLVFGVPASPLAQPWSVLGGNTVSALVGIIPQSDFVRALYRAVQRRGVRVWD